MLNRILVLSLCLFFSQTILAKPSPRPERCPDKATIMSTPLTMAEPIFSETDFMVYQFSNYQTKTPWGFMILPISAENSASAIHKANTMLPNIMGMPVPEREDEYNGWVCLYHLPDPEIVVGATTLEDNQSLKHLASLMHR
jgi:hypothetical protein